MITLDPCFLKAPIAHRALHDIRDGRPENSRSAIRAAIDAGYSVEIDLQLSSDGQPMVFHDYGLGRLAESTGVIRQYNRSALEKIRLRGNQETIPSLEEILDLVSGQVPLLIEFKDQDGEMGNNIGVLERASALLLARYPGPVAVMSFNPNSVAKLAECLPDIPRGLTTSGFAPDKWGPLPKARGAELRKIPDYARVGATFISHDVADLERPRVLDLKSQGAHVLCWTVTSPEIEAKARRIAENITFEQYLAHHPA